jgi:hypothetical protein
MDHTETRLSTHPLTLLSAQKAGSWPSKTRRSFLGLLSSLGGISTLALFGGALQGCGLRGDDVAGTSSGVDNPQIAVAFADSSGASARVSGTLSLYGENQNPALTSAPFATFRLDNSAMIQLSGLDIVRSLPGTSTNSTQTTGEPRVLAKASASIELGVETVDTVVSFNVYLRTDGKDGALAMGLTYDGRNKKFSLAQDTAATRLTLAPRPLRRVEAILSRPNPSEGPDRIFIAGTPFVAVVVDSQFILEEVPEGLFNLKLLTGEGKIYDVKEPLDPRMPGRFSYDKGDGHPIPDTTVPILDFGVSIRAESTAFLPSGSFLEGKLRGLSETDTRISWLWRLIDGVDSNAAIWSPTEAKTKVVYRAPGLYTFEVSATLGTVTHRDSQRVVVEGISLAETRFIAPGEGEMVMIGRGFRVVWHSDSVRRVRLSLDTGTADAGPFRLIDSTLQAKVGYNEFNWFVPFDLPDFTLASLVMSDSMGAIIARSGRFLLGRPPPPPP